MLISNIFIHFEPKAKIHNITFFCPEALFNASSVGCSNEPLKGSSNPLHNYDTFKRQSFIRPASTKGVEYERVWEHLQLQINPGGYSTAITTLSTISKECKVWDVILDVDWAKCKWYARWRELITLRAHLFPLSASALRLVRQLIGTKRRLVSSLQVIERKVLLQCQCLESRRFTDDRMHPAVTH